MIEPAYLQRMADGTIKQVNPFTGTRVWTVSGRADRPLTDPARPPGAIPPEQRGRACAFCPERYLETPPEKSRLVRRDGRWQRLDWLPAGQLFDSVAEFRVVPNLFEILSYDYWHDNYEYALPEAVAAIRQAYLSDAAGLRHVVEVQQRKMRAAGWSEAELAALSQDQLVAQATGFFGGGHDVVIARRHWLDQASDDSQLAGSGDLTPDEHRAYIGLTIDSAQRLYETNRYVRYVAVFQNWLKAAGASFDHLHKQLVAVDEHGTNVDLTLGRLRDNPNLFNEAGVNYASYHNLLIAENEAAVAYAGFGHRYPTIEVYSKSAEPLPWRQHPAEVDRMSDLIHALHAATGSQVPCNEEWHHQPPDLDLRMPWRVNLKWRVSTVAGFEGGTKLYINTISPQRLRDLVVPRLFELREQGRVADLRVAMECSGAPNPLRYNPNLV
jgi:galactose-1-phosphate uridylyltransferase